MADPVTLLAAGTMLSVGSSISEGMMYAAEGKARNRIAEYNADLLRRQSETRLEEARFEDIRQSRLARIDIGSAIAKAGKSGVEPNLQALSDLAYQHAIDRNLSLRQGLVESQGLLSQARMSLAEGKYARKTGQAKATAKYVKAGSSLLSGGYSIYEAMP